jgi:WD40 repeat protein
MTEAMQPHTPKRLAGRFTVLAAAVSLLSLTAALAQEPSEPAPAGDRQKEEEARRAEEQARAAHEKAMLEMRQKKASMNGPTASAFATLVTDPEGIVFGHRSSTLTERAGGQVTAIAFSADGKLAVTAGGRPGQRGFLKLWDAATGKELAFLRQPEAIGAVAFAPDGKALVTGESGGAIRLRDPARGTVRSTLGKHGWGVTRVQFAPQGHMLISGGEDGSLQVWDLASGKERPALPGHRSPVTHLEFSRDGKTLVSGGADATIRVWDWPAGKERRLISSPNPSINTLSLSPDGKTIAVAGQYQPIRLWSAETGKEVTPKKKDGDNTPRVFSPLQSSLAAAYSADGKSLAVITSDNVVRLADARTLEEKASFSGGQGSESPDSLVGVTVAPGGPPAAPNANARMVFSPDGKRLASASGSDERAATLWDVPGRRELTSLRSLPSGTLLRQPVLAMAATRDGKTVALVLEDRTIEVREVASGDVLARLRGHGDKVTCLAFSPDGSILASGSADNTVKLWNTTTGKERLTFRGHGNWVYAVAFSPDGRNVASGGYDRTIIVWDPRNGDPWTTLRGHRAAVRTLAIAPDGKTLASAGSDHTITLWDLPTGGARTTLQGHKATVRALAFSPDGKVLASTDESGTLGTWDVASGKRQALRAGEAEGQALAFSPSGMRLAVAGADTVVRLWPARGDSPRAFDPVEFFGFSNAGPTKEASPFVSLRGHADGVAGVAFTADGREIITAGFDRNVRVWQATDVPVQLLRGHTGPVGGSVFLPNGQHVLTWSGGPKGDGSLRLWDFTTGKEVRRYKTADPPVTVAVSADGRYFVTGGQRGAVTIYEGDSGRKAHSFKGPNGTVRSVAFAPDGSAVAAGGDGGFVCVWEVETGKQVECKGHTRHVRTLAFSADGKHVLSGGRDSTLRLWDASTGQSVRVMKGETALSGLAFVPPPGAKMSPEQSTELGVESVVFLADGKRVLCAEGPVLSIWDIENGKRLRRITGHNGRIDRVALLPGGRTAVTSSQDLSARLWDLETGKQLAMLDAFTVPQPQPQPQTYNMNGPYPQAVPVEPPPPEAVASDEPEPPAKKKEGDKEPPAKAKKEKKSPEKEKKTQADLEPPAGVVADKVAVAPDAAFNSSAQPLPPVGMRTTSNPDWAWAVSVSPDGRHLVTTGCFPHEGGPADARNPACIARVWRTPVPALARGPKP